MKTFDFRDMVAKTIGEKKVETEKRNLGLESNIKETKEGAYNVLGDAFWLKEAVSNLIENSIKYTKEGKITITLEHTKENKILLSVKDTGIGITSEDKQHLFTEGGRGKESIKINVDSTGYGLYSVKLVIEAHGGRVWAESEGAGKGSQFYIELNSIS
jgi:signal transduction histidine kinase